METQIIDIISKIELQKRFRFINNYLLFTHLIFTVLWKTEKKIVDT